MSEFKVIETQEQFDEVIGERLKRERETVEKKYENYLSPEDVQKKMEGYLSPESEKEKYKDYLSPEEVAKKDAVIKGYETNSVKMRIAHEYGIPFELASRLSGENEDEIKKDAESMKTILGNSTRPAPLRTTEGNIDKKRESIRKVLGGLKGE
ncbi:MAG: DUF4355 domain-containing protein [Lachnospiraceae bacterium]|nr:DUF4355 domain-containing protein [Lachnospiraceae bacterium]